MIIGIDELSDEDMRKALRALIDRQMFAARFALMHYQRGTDKQFIIDQMLRLLLSDEGYGNTIASYNSAFVEQPWDTGVAP